jgi:hypothetical protein
MAADYGRMISDLRAAGVASLRGIATALNERRIKTPRGQWRVASCDGEPCVGAAWIEERRMKLTFCVACGTAAGLDHHHLGGRTAGSALRG